MLTRVFGKYAAGLVLAFFLSLAATSLARADEIRLNSGDILYGKLVDITDDLIIFQDPTLGRLELPREKVKSIQVTTRLNLNMSKKVAASVGGSGMVVTTAPAAKTPATSPSTVPATMASATTNPAQNGEIPVTLLGPIHILPADWRYQVDVGVNGEQATDNSYSLHFGFLGKYDDAANRTKVDGSYNYGATDDVVGTNDATAGYSQDWLVANEKYFYFATARYDYNEFNNWNHRISVSGGEGYNFVQNDDLEVIGRAGAGFFKEFITDNQEITPEGNLGIELNWYLAQGQKLSAFNSYYPQVIHFGEYRMVSGADYTFKIAGSEHLAMKFGVHNEYQSDVEGSGTKPNDFKFLGSMIYAF